MSLKPSSPATILDDQHQFAAAFPSEKTLLLSIEQLLHRMPNIKEVQRVHGSQEFGKDLVFKTVGPLGEPIINACILKNERITGDANKTSSARTVITQALQAIDTAFTNLQGSPELVDHVYIMSPVECSQATLNSIKGQLRGHKGKITFRCGGELRLLFEQYWPEFIIQHSGLLRTYARSLHKDFDENAQLASVLTQYEIFGNVIKLFSKVYVPQSFHLRRFQFDYMDWHISGKIAGLRDGRDSGLRAAEKTLRSAVTLTRRAEEWITTKTFQKLYGQLREMQDTLNELRDFARMRQQDASQKLGDKAVAALSWTERVQREWHAHLSRVNNIISSDPKDPLEFLATPEAMQYMTTEQLVSSIPNLARQVSLSDLDFGNDLIQSYSRSLLIVGQPGLGKTSFCKWHAVRDIERLVRSEAEFFPVRVPLHQLSQASLSSFEKTFLQPFGAEGVRLTRGWRKPQYRLRLYLDGLDEVASIEQQRKIMNLARKGADENPSIQIIVTARDHVSGSWLSWLPRVQLSAFSQNQISQLAAAWLEDESRTTRFLHELTNVPALMRLMSVPLLATLIICVYRKHSKLPDSKVELYRIFVELLCGRWDEAKRVWRPHQFGWLVKSRVLIRFARLLQWNGRRDGDPALIYQAIQETAGNLLDQHMELTEELVADGLLVQMAGLYSFGHLSFQEYLAARDLADPSCGSDDRSKALLLFLRGDDWWREVLSFFVGLSNNPRNMASWLQKTISGFKIKREWDREEFTKRAQFLYSAVREAFPDHDLAQSS